MPKKVKNSGVISLGLVITLCILFSPVGMLLHIQREKQLNKLDMMRAARKILIVTGVYFLLFFILVTDVSTTGNPFTYLSLIAGIIGIIPGLKMINNAMISEKIKTAVETHDLRSANDIASMINVPDHIVIQTLLTMVKDGHFQGLRYDTKTNTLCPSETEMVKILQESRAAECIYCGAKVTLFKDKINKCEYCGSGLNYKDNP